MSPSMSQTCAVQQSRSKSGRGWARVSRPRQEIQHCWSVEAADGAGLVHMSVRHKIGFLWCLGVTLGRLEVGRAAFISLVVKWRTAAIERQWVALTEKCDAQPEKNLSRFFFSITCESKSKLYLNLDSELTGKICIVNALLFYRRCVEVFLEYSTTFKCKLSACIKRIDRRCTFFKMKIVCTTSCFVYGTVE